MVQDNEKREGFVMLSEAICHAKATAGVIMATATRKAAVGATSLAQQQQLHAKKESLLLPGPKLAERCDDTVV